MSEPRTLNPFKECIKNWN